MKSVRLVAPRQPLQNQDVPVPMIGGRDVLVRVRAAGVCHSDVHYRAGKSPVHPLPLTLGHEVAGVVEAVGPSVGRVRVGDRVCLHYLLTCGNCFYCSTGNEQFCTTGKMIGHHADGGYAEYIAVPERNAVPLPDKISFEQGATLMCASATSFHALRKSRLAAGETVAVFGAGGLGMSAIQLARAFGALDVFAVDVKPGKLALAEKHGAVPVNAAEKDAAAEIRSLTAGRGVDVALEMIGLPKTMRQAVQSLAILGRAVIVGISDQPVPIDTYHELLGPEAEIVGSNDHLLRELPLLVEFARRGVLDLSDVVTRTIPLEAGAVNEVLDDLEHFGDAVRTVVVP
jgi:D-arabinose 1-dehydrogenase-like Zn-dependent alcohol dehydrogenase